VWKLQPLRSAAVVSSPDVTIQQTYSSTMGGYTWHGTHTIALVLQSCVVNASKCHVQVVSRSRHTLHAIPQRANTLLQKKRCEWWHSTWLEREDRSGTDHGHRDSPEREGRAVKMLAENMTGTRWQIARLVLCHIISQPRVLSYTPESHL